MAQEKKPAAEPAKQTPKEEPRKDAKDIVAAATDAKLMTFVDLLKVAGLDTALKTGTHTVFAPTDEAFKKYGNLDDLKKDKEKLATLLKGHIVAKKVDPKVDKDAKPMAGPDIKLSMKDGKIMVNDKIAAGKEVVASNGVIYEIDTVIAAAAPTPKPAEPKPAAEPKGGEKKPEKKQ